MANEKTPLTTSRGSSSDSNAAAAPTGMDRIKKCLVDFYQKNLFLLKAILAIIIAKLYPPLGAEYMYPDITAQWMAVMFIFGMAGMLIKTAQLGNAVKQCGFNSFVLAFNYFGVSAIVFGATRILLKYNLLDEGMADGMIVCSCMPMSISMVTVFTRMSNGETANAALIAPTSVFMSVFLSPMLILFYINTKTQIDLLSVIVKLLLRVLLPMITGQFLQFFAKPVVRYVDDNIGAFKKSQEYALIYIIYSVFCKTFQQSIDAEIMDILSMAIFQAVLLVICTITAWISMKILFRDSPRLRAMGMFGCVQKSVAVGIPLIGAIYEHDPKLAGLYALPLLIWHPAQMILGSALIPHLAEGVEKLETYLEAPHRQSVRFSFFGSQTRMRASSSAAYNYAIGSVVFDNEDMVLAKLDAVDAEDMIAAEVADKTEVYM